MSIKIIFRQIGKQNLIINTDLDIPFNILVQKFYKADCTSKKTKEQIKFIFNGNEVSADNSSKLRDLKMGHLSEIKIYLRDYASIQYGKDDWKEGIVNNLKNATIPKIKLSPELNKNIKVQDELKVNSIDEVKLIYRIDKSKLNVKIFGADFVKNNKDKCKIRHSKGTIELREYFDIDDDMKNQEALEIIIMGVTKITNMSNMFQECRTLLSISDMSKLDMTKVTDISGMFSLCESLTAIPDISNWNTVNITSMAALFLFCQSIETVPDISNWNTSNVTNISSLFGICQNLKSVPDISKWDTRNMTAMNAVFFGCVSLKSLPDISKWDTSSVNNIGFLFGLCASLEYLPDISKWDATNFENIERLFYNCGSLKKIPNILLWVKHWKQGKTMKIAEMFGNISNNLDEESKKIVEVFKSIFKMDK